MSKLNADNKLPADMPGAFALYAIFRDICRQVNKLTDTVMAQAKHSAGLTGDALVATGPSVYRGFVVTVVTATAGIDIRDGTAAGAGTIIDTIPAATAAGTRVERSVGIACDAGIYADYGSTATGTIVVLYE